MEKVVTDKLLHTIAWKRIDRIQQATGWTEKDLAERLRYTEREFYKKRASRKPLKAEAGIFLAEELQVEVGDLFYGQIDFSALERHFHGDSDYLPERYQIGAFSRMRTSLHLLEHCDSRFGSRFADQMLRSLQVKRVAFADPNRFISIRFLIDSCEYLFNRLNGDTSIFPQIGMYSAVLNKKAPISPLLSRSRSVAELYDIQINHLMERFDKNAQYRTIALSEDHCIIESKERDEAKDALSGGPVGSRLTCLTRVGVAAAIAGFLDLPFGSVKKTHCIFQGDSTCRFHVEYQHARVYLENLATRELQVLTQRR